MRIAEFCGKIQTEVSQWESKSEQGRESVELRQSFHDLLHQRRALDSLTTEQSRDTLTRAAADIWREMLTPVPLSSVAHDPVLFCPRPHPKHSLSHGSASAATAAATAPLPCTKRMRSGRCGGGGGGKPPRSDGSRHFRELGRKTSAKAREIQWSAEEWWMETGGDIGNEFCLTPSATTAFDPCTKVGSGNGNGVSGSGGATASTDMDSLALHELMDRVVSSSLSQESDETVAQKQAFLQTLLQTTLPMSSTGNENQMSSLPSLPSLSSLSSLPSPPPLLPNFMSCGPESVSKCSTEADVENDWIPDPALEARCDTPGFQLGDDSLYWAPPRARRFAASSPFAQLAFRPIQEAEVATQVSQVVPLLWDGDEEQEIRQAFAAALQCHEKNMLSHDFGFLPRQDSLYKQLRGFVEKYDFHLSSAAASSSATAEGEDDVFVLPIASFFADHVSTEEMQCFRDALQKFHATCSVQRPSRPSPSIVFEEEIENRVQYYLNHPVLSYTMKMVPSCRWHHLVSDHIDESPTSVTFAPCTSTFVF